MEKLIKWLKGFQPKTHTVPRFYHSWGDAIYVNSYGDKEVTLSVFGLRKIEDWRKGDYVQLPIWPNRGRISAIEYHGDPGDLAFVRVQVPKGS